jgi:outer membrane protein
MSLRRRAALAATVSLSVLLAAGGAVAETLADAIALAYQTNPTLQSQRAQLRALDENYVQARSGYRPTAELGAVAQYNNDSDTPGIFGTTDGETNAGSISLTLQQPLYTGGRVANGVSAAEADILAGREDLREIEASVLLSTIQAYVDVVRDVESLRIRQENVGVLRRQLEEARARFEVGEITRTDVAQSEARLANAEALLSQAQAQLAISRSNYAALVGQNPGDLQQPPPLPGLPATVDEAFDLAQDASPQITSAEFVERAARSRVAQARSDQWPTVALQGQVSQSGPLVPFDRSETRRDLTVSAVVTQPLFAGGLRRSRIRQAQQQNTSALIAIESERREVLRRVSQAWNQLLAARASIASSEEQVRAARIAAEGVREEASVGLRTTLDVLNAETELRNAQLFLAQSRRDEYVATASALSAMGRLEARQLLAAVDIYDPARNLDRIKAVGAVPWEPVVEALDQSLSPYPATRPDPRGEAKRTTQGPMDGPVVPRR